MTGFDHLDVAWLAAKPGVKWSRVEPGALAAWVADMDFPIPAVVTTALQNTLAGGDLGYPNLDAGNPLAEAFVERMRRRHGWNPDPGRVWSFTDVLNAVQAILEVSTDPGDGVAIHAPTYPPFPAALRKMGRRIVPIPFASTPGGWEFTHSLASAGFARPTALLLVNPHNPTGRVLTRAELEELAAFANTHELMVISDEVHAELAYDGATHIPFASLGDDAAARTITITSASKSFNLAGIRTAVAHFGHDGAWEAVNARPEHLWGVVSNLSIAATLAAWHQGDDWLRALRTRLAENRAMVAQRLGDAAPEIRWHPPDATYLAWLDCSQLGVGDDPAGFFREAARVELSPGPDFGPEGVGYVRLNFATAPNVLDAILERMVGAVDRHRR